MSADILLELSKSPQARTLVKALGLPLPMPTPLVRGDGPSAERPLDGATVAVQVGADAVGRAICEALVGTGARLAVAGQAPALLGELAEAWGRPVGHVDLDGEPGVGRVRALVFDGTGLRTPSALHALYAFFHPLLDALDRNGRAIVVGRPPEEAADPAEAATQAALEGFVRSLAKEVGRKGATALLLEVGQGAEERLAGPLRFALSPRSAYVTGQPLRVTHGTPPVAGPPRWTFPLEQKTALVTGAARGIGRATAELLAAEGAHVVCLDRPEDQDAAARLARTLHGRVLGVDVTAPDAAAQIAEAFGEHGVDIVVHNAGITRDKTLARMKPAFFDLAIAVNLEAVERITRHLLEQGRINPFGRVVCLSSVAGLAGNMGQTNYAAAKRGVVGYVQALAPTVAAKGITVNAVAPGFIETRMTDAMPTALREVARRMNSLGQAGQPADVAEAIAFFASPGAQGITGQTLRVCGQALIGA